MIRYITREDASPLMGALVLWRTTALQSNLIDLPPDPSSPLSPQSDDEPLSSSDERDEFRRSGSEPLETSRKPKSSSWSRWWSRSRNNRDAEGGGMVGRPELRGTASDAVSFNCILNAKRMGVLIVRRCRQS